MLTFRYRSTNCHFVPGREGGLLAFDAGWPCSLFEYIRNMKSIGLRFEDLRWAIVSHMHMDHAGLLGEFIARGIRCYALEGQVEAVDAMERTILKGVEYAGYRRIRKDELVPLRAGDAASELASLGIDARVIRTPGHSPDSVTLITGGGEALVGDLAPPDQLMPDDISAIGSWRDIRAAGGTAAFPAHAAEFPL